MTPELPLPTVRAMSLMGDFGVRPQLTSQQRQKLAAAATRLQLPARSIVYRGGDTADHFFINGGGVVVSFKELASGKRRVQGFRLFGDVFGLADRGRYVNTTRAVTPVTVYRIPAETLTTLLQQDAGLEFQFLCKMVEELRFAQRKAIIVARKDATGRVAMFVDLLRGALGLPPDTASIEVPMNRSDMADYLNLTLESVSRACAKLKRDGILVFDKRVARILDHKAFAELIFRA